MVGVLCEDRDGCARGCASTPVRPFGAFVCFCLLQAEHERASARDALDKVWLTACYCVYASTLLVCAVIPRSDSADARSAIVLCSQARLFEERVQEVENERTDLLYQVESLDEQLDVCGGTDGSSGSRFRSSLGLCKCSN
jgi:hypothetical protein